MFKRLSWIFCLAKSRICYIRIRHQTLSSTVSKFKSNPRYFQNLAFLLFYELQTISFYQWYNRAFRWNHSAEPYSSALWISPWKVFLFNIICICFSLNLWSDDLFSGNPSLQIRDRILTWRNHKISSLWCDTKKPAVQLCVIQLNRP